MAAGNKQESQSVQSDKPDKRDEPSRAHLKTISIWSALGFGAGDFFGGGQLALVTTYLALFWTRFCGMNISVAQGIIGTSAIISAVSALLFGVLDDNLYRYRIGRRFGRRHFMLMLIAPSLFIGILLWIPGSPVWLYACVYVLWVMLAQAFQACLQPVGRRDDEGLQPANEIVDYTNVHFHSRSHIHPACRKLGVVDVWRDQGNRLYGGGHHLDGAVRLCRSGHMEDHLGDDT